MTAALRLSSAGFEAIRRAAARTPHLEACGLLIEDRGIACAFPAPNRHPEPATGFAICDAVYARLQRRARERGARIVGCFHSHPSGETEPSETDLLGAQEDGFVWVIAAPDGRMQAWRARLRGGSKSFERIALELAGPAQSAIAAARGAT